MEKRYQAATLLLVALMSLGFAGLVFAEDRPPAYTQPGGGCPMAPSSDLPGPGMLGRGGPGMMNPAACPMAGGALMGMHAAMRSALAEGFELPPGMDGMFRRPLTPGRGPLPEYCPRHANSG